MYVCACVYDTLLCDGACENVFPRRRSSTGSAVYDVADEFGTTAPAFLEDVDDHDIEENEESASSEDETNTGAGRDGSDVDATRATPSGRSLNSCAMGSSLPVQIPMAARQPFARRDMVVGRAGVSVSIHLPAYWIGTSGVVVRVAIDTPLLLEFSCAGSVKHPRGDSV